MRFNFILKDTGRWRRMLKWNHRRKAERTKSFRRKKKKGERESKERNQRIRLAVIKGTLSLKEAEIFCVSNE